jgi:hypothetical protein
MSAHLLAYRDDILMAAPFGYLGAAAVTAFSVGLGRRIARRGERTAGAVVAAAGTAVGLYFLALHLVYTSLAYQVAGSSAEATKALFVPTIMATPARVASAVDAMIAIVRVFGYAETGYLYADVQQQWVGNVLLLWTLVTAATLLVTGLRSDATSGPRRRQLAMSRVAPSTRAGALPEPSPRVGPRAAPMPRRSLRPPE